jgi:hypothetical protein
MLDGSRSVVVTSPIHAIGGRMMGAPGGIRTRDQQISSLPLYPSELPGRMRMVTF